MGGWIVAYKDDKIIGLFFLSVFVDECQGKPCLSSVIQYLLSAPRVTALEFESLKKFEVRV